MVNSILSADSPHGLAEGDASCTPGRISPFFLPCRFSFHAACALATAGTDQPSPAHAEFFEKNVRPLLVEKCWPCHGTNDKPKGGLRLTSRTNVLKGGDSGPAAVAGDPAASLIIQAIRYDQDPKMPPKGKLSDREIDVLLAVGRDGPSLARSQGISSVRPLRPNGGARAASGQRGFWSFQPVKAVAVPSVRDARPARTAIDRFLLADLEKHAIEPARARRPAHADPPGHLRPDRPAADARGDRRVPRRQFARTRSRGSSTACWPRRATASAGAGTGSTSSAMPTPAT